MEATKKPRMTKLKAVGRLERPLEQPLKQGKVPRGTPTRPVRRACRNPFRLFILACLVVCPITFVMHASADTAYSPTFTPGAQREGHPWQCSSFALKRPKPGSIWQGPKDVWCLFPSGRHSSVDLPAGPQLEPTEQADPSPEIFLSPPAVSPLLFFLTTLPTLEDVTCYFAAALGEVPVLEGQQKLRFERWLVFVWGNSWRRCVLSGSARGAPGVTVDWWTNDDFGLSELREFFEAPFFLRRESERFYQWLAEGGAHEADFRGHRLRMAVHKRDGVLSVRIQWWRGALESESSEAPLDLDAPLQASARTQ